MAFNKISRQAAPHIKGFPACCVVTKTADASQNEDVLYNLVIPADTHFNTVKSADGIVNVVPPNRIYDIGSIEEFDAFRLELLKRPTVLHFRVTYIGCPLLENISPRLTCGATIDTENWLLLIHQLHPKILGRLQMGFDHARTLLSRDKPLFLHFNFNAALTHHFSNIWMWYENNREYRQVKVQIDGADLIVKYGKRGAFVGFTTELMFSFEDFTMHDFAIRRPADAVKVIGSTSQPQSANESNLRQQLPGWEFSLDPNNELNTAIRSRYSYASASRMITKMMAVPSSIEEESAI